MTVEKIISKMNRSKKKALFDILRCVLNDGCIGLRSYMIITEEFTEDEKSVLYFLISQCLSCK